MAKKPLSQEDAARQLEQKHAKKRDKDRRYRERHLEELRAKERLRSEKTRKDPDKIPQRNATQRKYRTVHADKIKADYWANRDVISAARRTARADDPEKFRAQDRKRKRVLSPKQRDRANANARVRWKESPDGNAAKRAKTAGWRADNKEHEAARDKLYRIRNAEKVKSWRLISKGRKLHLKWYVTHAEKRRQAALDAYWSNPQRAREAQKMRRKTHPESMRAIDARSRAKRNGAEGFWTPLDIARILKAQRSKCALCRISIKKGFHRDHIVPLSKGGTNWPRNIQLLCAPCNLRKHARDPIDFARQLGKLI